MRDETSVRHHRRWCRSALVKSPDCGGGMEMSLAKEHTFGKSRAMTEEMSQGREGNRRL